MNNRSQQELVTLLENMIDNENKLRQMFAELSTNVELLAGAVSKLTDIVTKQQLEINELKRPKIWANPFQ